MFRNDISRAKSMSRAYDIVLVWIDGDEHDKDVNRKLNVEQG